MSLQEHVVKADLALGAVSQSPPLGARNWKFLREQDSVAVYEEEVGRDGSGGAIMVSTTLHSSPKNCMKALLSEQSDVAWAPAACLFDSMKLIKQKDNNTRIVKGRLRTSPGLASRLCGPWEAVVESSWRKEGDGAYVVLLRTTELAEDTCSQEHQLSGDAALVQDLLCGLTLSPSSSHTNCLVTAILQVDLGGWLSKRSAFYRLLSSASTAVREGFINCLLKSLRTLEFQVQQLRHKVSRPPKPPSDACIAPDTAEQLNERSANLDDSVNSDPNFDRLAADDSDAEFEAGSSEYNEQEPEEQPEVPSNGTLPQHFWSCPGSGKFRVRGQTYLLDQKKVKASEPACTLASMDLLKLEKSVFHIAQYLPNIRNSPAPFTFVIQLMVPGRPAYSLTMAWAADFDPYSVPPPASLPSNLLMRSSSDLANMPSSSPVARPEALTDSPGLGSSSARRRARLPRSSSASSVAVERSTSSGGKLSAESPAAAGEAPNGLQQMGATMAFKRCLARFLADEAGNDKQRNSRFKIIPNIVEGSWLVKQAVGNTPALLGNKLTTKYFRGQNYFEVDVDIGSSATAQSIVSLAISATKSLVVDMAFVLEGKCAEELPEQLLGTVRLHRLDMEAAIYIDTDNGGMLYT